MLETICDIMVDAYKRNWITSRDGNVSIRHHDPDHFYITPSGVRMPKETRVEPIRMLEKPQDRITEKRKNNNVNTTI